MVKITALTTTIVITNEEISYPCFDRRVQNVSLAPRLPFTDGNPRENHVMIVAAILSSPLRSIFSHVISRIYIVISESENGNSHVGKPQTQYVGFCATYIFFFWWFRRKMNREISPRGQINNIYFLCFFYHLLQLVLSSVLHRFRTVVHYTICGTVCFHFTHFPCDDWQNKHFVL